MNRLAALLFVAAAVPAAQAASLTVGFDRASFEASLGGPVTVETFTNDAHYPISTGVLNSHTDLVVASGGPITPGMIKPGVTYSVDLPMPTYGFNIDLGAQFEGGFLDTVQGNGPLKVVFDAPVTGFGFDTNDFTGGVLVTVHFSDQTSEVAERGRNVVRIPFHKTPERFREPPRDEHQLIRRHL